MHTETSSAQNGILTPVLTRDNIILSFKANVSPCFILILFLSKHFIAYLETNVIEKTILQIYLSCFKRYMLYRGKFLKIWEVSERSKTVSKCHAKKIFFLILHVLRKKVSAHPPAGRAYFPIP